MTANLFCRCPRCGRVGAVSLDPLAMSALLFVVVWEGPARGHEATAEDPHDRDTSVGIDDLFDPEFGCGYDPEESVNE